MTARGVATWRTVQVDGAAVRLMEAGDPSHETLLFLHGWGLSPRAYADGITRLTAAGVRVLAPALPGFGGSDGPPLTGVDLPAYAARIGRLLDVLEVEHPVFVVGHSFGGGVALQLATDRPERGAVPDAGELRRRSAGRPGRAGRRQLGAVGARRGGRPQPARAGASRTVAAARLPPEPAAQAGDDGPDGPAGAHRVARRLRARPGRGGRAGAVRLGRRRPRRDAGRARRRRRLAAQRGRARPPRLAAGRARGVRRGAAQRPGGARDARAPHAGQALVLPHGFSLADVVPAERRSAARVPQQRRPR
jgi:pimeloyl-ACP methyl ester carboxylesterase